MAILIRPPKAATVSCSRGREPVAARRRHEGYGGQAERIHALTGAATNIEIPIHLVKRQDRRVFLKTVFSLYV